MLTDWFTRPLRAALGEIGLMRKERDWARIDDMVGEVEAKIASLNEHQADRYSGAQLHWQRGRLAWEGLTPAELPGIGERSDPARSTHSRDIER